jgi:hypothetical protein
MDHPQEDLAKFGSRSEKKVDFFSQTLLYILATYKDLCSKYGEFHFFFFPSKYGNFVPFSHKNPLNNVAAPFVLSPKKKKTLPSILSKLKLSINVYNFKIDF